MSRNLTFESATHLLICQHVIGSNRTEYLMRCHVIKHMPDRERVKVMVFGDRYWKGSHHRSRIRYVHRNRLRPITRGGCE